MAHISKNVEMILVYTFNQAGKNCKTNICVLIYVCVCYIETRRGEHLTSIILLCVLKNYNDKIKFCYKWVCTCKM